MENTLYIKNKWAIKIFFYNFHEYKKLIKIIWHAVFNFYNIGGWIINMQLKAAQFPNTCIIVFVHPSIRHNLRKNRKCKRLAKSSYSTIYKWDTIEYFATMFIYIIFQEIISVVNISDFNFITIEQHTKSFERKHKHFYCETSLMYLTQEQ